METISKGNYRLRKGWLAQGLIQHQRTKGNKKKEKQDRFYLVHGCCTRKLLTYTELRLC